MKIPSSSRFRAPVFLRPLACLCLVATGALADERNPNLLERIGNFFYNVANKIERSDGPEDRGRSPSSASRSRPPVRGTKGNEKAAQDAARNTHIAPVNPDPHLLRPRGPTSESSSAATAGDRHSGNAHHPATLESSRATPPPIKSTAPLPESAKPGKARESAESSAGGATSQSKKASDAPVAVRPDEGGYPAAIRTNRLGRVKSPYPPHRELDVAGLPPGSLAKDPVTGKIFRVP